SLTGGTSEANRVEQVMTCNEGNNPVYRYRQFFTYTRRWFRVPDFHSHVCCVTEIFVDVVRRILLIRFDIWRSARPNMPHSLKEKVAIITGASRGIGKAIAIKFASQGIKIAVGAKTVKTSAKMPGTIFDTVKEIEAHGSKAIAVQTDVRDETALKHLVQTTYDQFGRIDILVNNAGAIVWQPIGDLPIKRFDLMTQINYRAPYVLCHEAFPFMKQQTSGFIINMSPPPKLGFLATDRWAGRTAYLMSKFGMSHLTMGLADELKAYDISVNSLWPANIIDTQATRVFAEMFEADRESYWYSADLIADACLEIVKSTPNELTGQMLIAEDFLATRGVDNLETYRVPCPV
ncbi:SDR family oxidoreductase, partial [bacterium]|nr:SDR family oxidoreductase [bacterium]